MSLTEDILGFDISTPAFIYSEKDILFKLKILNEIKTISTCKMYFALKAFSFYDSLEMMINMLDGFSASSLFEARLSFNVINGRDKSIHLTSPLLKEEEMSGILTYCNYISFNSIEQWLRFRDIAENNSSCGIRINPGISFVSDNKYNPCRKHSKLGVPIQALIENQGLEWMQGIRGLHFHTNCESDKFRELLETVKLIGRCLPKFLSRIDWVNLGGGYLFSSEEDFDEFIEAVLLLKEKFGLEVVFEPGKGIIGQAGTIVSTVVDIFINDGHSIAVLDTTTNHMPEVFEYQYRPDVAQESEEGKYPYILAGATCLAGDVFGEYRFDKPLEIGSRIVFENMGAYTMVKANMFNGINLPTIYAYTTDRKLEMKKQFTYDDFLSRCGGR